MTTLPPPECHLGYPAQQLWRELGEQAFKRLMLWMEGQTMAICEGTAYVHTGLYDDPPQPERGGYFERDCWPLTHGTVVYAWDVERWLRAGPVID